jgi:predicted O-linked N-acetylglucosamine transferase (SPINDLY family)/predicted SAM-dependent methyltransferase/glycosyltransferase involved in cell wall biosynthesis
MKVSVLMIAYNHENFIGQAIDSILMQDVDFEYEIVIGEDCSTDSTRQIIIDCQKKYPDKIRLLLPESNLGMLPNFVNTYRACKGQYIALLEGDDYWTSPDKLRKQVEFLDREKDYAICFTNALLFWEDNHREPEIFLNEPAEKFTTEYLLFRNFISTPTVMYRNGLIQEFPQWYTNLGMGDWSLYILLTEYGKIGYIDEVMSAYRNHKGGVWSSKHKDYQLTETIRMLSVFENFFASKNNHKYQIILNDSIDCYSKQLSSNIRTHALLNGTPGSTLYFNQSKPYKLHIGCGKNIFPDWINIDIEANSPGVDLICDVRGELPFNDGSCSLIYNEHVLEHLTVEEGLFFLKECRRVLQPGGTLRIAMPDLENIVQKYNSEDWRDQDWLRWPDYQFVKTRAEMINISFRWWEHKWLYNLEELNRRLLEAGYLSIQTAAWGKSNIPDFQSRETREDSILIIEAESPIVALENIPLVSVCIPTYNGEKFLEETLNTVLNQTYSNLEIIISDDNSKDRTIEISKSFREKLACEFSIIEHEQYGLSQNWNYCISQAKGKYVKFVFQDDLLEPNAISDMVEIAEQDEEIGLVFSPRRLFISDGDNYYNSSFLEHHGAKDIHKGWSKLKAIQPGRELLEDRNLFNYSINKIGEPTTVLIKKEIFDKVGLFNSELCQLVDLEMWLRIVSECKVGFVNKYLSHFRLHEHQQTNRNSAEQGLIFLDHTKFFYIIYSDTRYPDLARQNAFYRYVLLCEENSEIAQVRTKLVKEWLAVPADLIPDTYQGILGKAHQILLLFGNLTSTKLTQIERDLVHRLSSTICQEYDGADKSKNLLVCMLYSRADRLNLTYDLSFIPDWLLQDYLKFLFSAPVNFSVVEEATIYFKYIQGWMNYIHDSVFNNLDDRFWQDIASKFAQIANFIPAYFNETNLKDIYVKRAEIIELDLKNNGQVVDYQFPERPASRKKIRLGILASHFNPSAETFATLPIYEYLSRDFEVVLYSFQQTNHPLEQYCRSSANFLVTLPPNLSEQVDAIRSDDLDILFFASNVTAVTNQICLLASHRLARIQITSGGSVVTTGMRHMDYFISGTLTDPAPDAQLQYREKLIQLPGAAHCFSYGDFEETSSIIVDRERLGITENAVVFTSGANFYKIIPELIHTWAKIIVAVPNSIIILFPFGPNWSSNYPKQAFANHLRSIFSTYGVSADRILTLDPQPIPNREDLKEYLKLADIYLDSYPFAGTTSLIEPLQINLPVIARQGNTFRSSMGAAMIRSLDIADLVADSEESYIQLAIALGINAELRHQKRAEIKAKMSDNSSFLDSKGYSEKIGKLFTELVDGYAVEKLSDDLRLRDVNWMIFPDWNQSEESVGLELQQVIQTLATQPDSQKTTLLIDTSNIDMEDAQMFLSSIAMNLMMEEDLDITDELEISLIEDLNDIQWATLLPKIDARIVMKCDNQAAVGKLSLSALSQLEIASFMLSNKAFVSN